MLIVLAEFDAAKAKMAQIPCGKMVFEMKTQGANKDRKQAEQPKVFAELVMPAVLPDSNGGFMPCAELLTEEELVIFLRIPHVSNSKNYHNVIENLKRMHGLPRIHICGKPLYPREAINEWIKNKTTNTK